MTVKDGTIVWVDLLVAMLASAENLDLILRKI